MGERPINWLNWPNAITVSRFLVYLPALYLLWAGRYLYVVVALAVVSALADNLDGYVARKTGQETEFGRVLDPVLDKVSIGATALIVAWKFAGPVWLVLLVIAKDFLLVAGHFLLFRTRAKILRSNIFGKVAAASLVFTFVVFMLGFPPGFLNVVYAGAAVLNLLSFFSYGALAIRAARLTRRGLEERF